MLGWAGAALLLVAAFFAAFAALNQTVYGASSFVERYLDAIARDDVLTAAATPGVALSAAELEGMGLPADTSRALLRSGVVDEGPSDVRITGDELQDDGSHEVTASYRVGAAIMETTFHVEPIPPLYGVLARWAFATSPLAVLDVTVDHGPYFTVGDDRFTLDARFGKEGDELKAFSQSASYLAIAPASYSLSYDDTLLHADAIDVVAVPSERVDATLDVQATTAFTERVQAKLDEHLQACTEQHVLQPADCPFGTYIEDRVTTEPDWTIVASPPVTLTPGADGFDMPETQGTAHLSVEVQSLFDGSYEQHEEDVPFTIALTARVTPDGNIIVSLR